MKNRETILAVAASLIAQIGIGYAIRMATRIMSFHWQEVLGGKALPQLTTIALRFGVAVPIGATVLILVGVAIPLLRARAQWWLLGVVLVEAITLAVLMIGLAAPSISVTYQMGT